MGAAKKQSGIQSAPALFTYHNFREFIQDWVNHQKTLSAKFSLRKLSLEAGLSPGFLPQVLASQRSLSEKSINKLSQALGFSENEKNYFSALVDLSDSKNQDTRSKAFRRIKRYHKYKEENQNELAAHQLVSQWYIVAIKELANTPSFQWDVKWIQKRLDSHVPAKKISEALAFLEENSFLKRKADGTATVLKKSVRCHEGIFQLALSESHAQMLDLAKRSIDQHDRFERELRGYSLALDEKTYLKIREIINKSIQDIAEAEDNQESETSKRVYHIEISAFPLTKKEGKK